MKNLLAIRKKLGLTQAELAHRVGIGMNSLARYERGEIQPSIEVASLIAKKLGITVDELLNGSPEGKVRVTLSYDINKMKEGEIDMDSEGFDLFLCKNGFIGLRGGVMLSPERTIDDVMSEIRKELERGLALQVERGTIQKA